MLPSGVKAKKRAPSQFVVHNNMCDVFLTVAPIEIVVGEFSPVHEVKRLVILLKE